MLIEDVKRLSPIARLLYFITERESIRLKKEAGEAKPWTDDEILQSYRFCNIRRMDDAVSCWLWSNWYEPFRDHPNMVYAAATARFINLPGPLFTIRELVFKEGPPDVGNIKSALREIKREGCQVFNGAYMVRGNDGMDKISSVFDFYLPHLLTDPITVNTSSMEQTWKQLEARYGFGSFMAGQVVADLRWALTGDWDDRDTWAPMGPGSAKGLNCTLGRPATAPMKQTQFLAELTHLILFLRDRLPAEITDRLEAHDYQNICCEYFKMHRALEGGTKPKSKYPGV